MRLQRIARTSLASVVMAALLGILGCGKQATATFGAKDRRAKSGDKDPSLTAGKADFTLTAEEWQKEWKNGPEAAKKKYDEKLIELSGEIDDSDMSDPYGRIGYVYLKVPGGGNVRCGTEDKEPWFKVGPGCKVRIQGKPDGSTGDLYPCIIVESSPNTTQTISARELTKECASDWKGAKEKYEDKWLIIEGEVSSKPSTKPDLPLLLKGEAEMKIRCACGDLSEFERKRNDSIRVGQQIKVCGKVRIDDEDKKISMNRPMLPTNP
jgi:hypothetical protein